MTAKQALSEYVGRVNFLDEDEKFLEGLLDKAAAEEREECAKDRARLAAAMCILEDCWQGMTRAEIAAMVDDLAAIRAREER